MINKNVGIIKRLLAFVIDCHVWFTFLLFPPFLLSLMFKNNSNLDLALGTITFVVSAILLGGFINLAYNAYFVSKFGGTIGKLLFGIRIVDRESGELLSTKRAFYRSFFGYAFSAQFFGLGFWRIAKHPEKLGWHDEMFNTKVIKVGSVLPGIIMGAVFTVVVSVLIGMTVVNTTEGLKGIEAPFPLGTNPMFDMDMNDDFDFENLPDVDMKNEFLFDDFDSVLPVVPEEFENIPVDRI